MPRTRQKPELKENDMWKELFIIAPDLIPIIIQTIIDVEKVVTGLKRGEVRKSRVMNIVGNILDTKDYFLGRPPEGQLQFLNLISMFIDAIVVTFNYVGLFPQPTGASVRWGPDEVFIQSMEEETP